MFFLILLDLLDFCALVVFYCFGWFFAGAFFATFSLYFQRFHRRGGPLRLEKGSKISAPRALESCREGVQRKKHDFHKTSAARRREREFRAPRGVQI